MPAHDAGLTILPKKKKKTLKVTKLTGCMNFRMIQAVIKCFERSTVERIEGNSNVSRCLFIRCKYGHCEMRNKKLINTRNDIIQGWQFCSPKDPFSLTVMLCALFVVKRGHWPEQPLLDQFMASDLGYRDRNFWRYSQFAAKGWFCKCVWFPFGRNESEQNEDDGATRSKTREIQVVCFAYIFQTLFKNVFCTL